MNAIDFLIKEHEKVRKMLAEIDNPSHRHETKKNMFDMLCEDLIRHETMEQKVWYPYFKDHLTLDHEVKHLITEEKHAEKAIKSLESVKSEAAWQEKFLKFKKEVEHHADEEEKKLFPNVKKMLSEAELEIIGKKMKEFKDNYKR